MLEDRAGSLAARGGAVTLSSALVTLSTVEQRLVRGLTTALSEAEVSVEQWRILELVDALAAPTMGDLASASGLAGASLSRTVDALEDEASVFRLADAADRRRITVRLSDRGAARLRGVRAIVAAWDADMNRALGSAAIERLGGQLASMSSALDAGTAGAVMRE